jgi:signal peptidase II
VPLVALDLWSKAAAFAYVKARNPDAVHDAMLRVRDVDFLPDPFGFHLVAWKNTGTIFGLGKDMTAALAVLRAVALFVLVYFAWRTARSRRLQLLVLGLIFSGAVGNLYDNLSVDGGVFAGGGGVRDFLLFFLKRDEGGPLEYPAFNVADSCISVGAIALAILLWRHGEGATSGAKSR